MAQLYDLARMTTATTGFGTITLGAAVSGFLSFAGAGAQDGDTVTYAISDGANSEIGRGVYTASGTTLTRSVLKSTNANAAINLSGSAQVFITPAAEDLALPQSTNRNVTLNPPLASQFPGFIQLRGGGTTGQSLTDDASNGLIITETPGSTIGIKAFYRTLGSAVTTFEFAAKVFFGVDEGNYTRQGLCFGDGAGNWALCGKGNQGFSYAGGFCTGDWWASNNDGAGSGMWPPGHDWIRLTYGVAGSGTVEVSTSGDGVHWSRMTNFLWASQVEYYGFFYSTDGGVYAVPLVIPWFYSTELPAPSSAPIAGVISI